MALEKKGAGGRKDKEKVKSKYRPYRRTLRERPPQMREVNRGTGWASNAVAARGRPSYRRRNVGPSGVGPVGPARGGRGFMGGRAPIPSGTPSGTGASYPISEEAWRFFEMLTRGRGPAAPTEWYR